MYALLVLYILDFSVGAFTKSNLLFGDIALKTLLLNSIKIHFKMTVKKILDI